MKEKFLNISFSVKKITLLETVENILDDFTDQGFTLTLRQLYYQLVKANIYRHT